MYYELLYFCKLIIKILFKIENFKEFDNKIDIIKRVSILKIVKLEIKTKLIFDYDNNHY